MTELSDVHVELCKIHYPPRGLFYPHNVLDYLYGKEQNKLLKKILCD